MSQYILQCDDAAQKRLNMQHELYAPASQQLLIRAGLQSHQSVLEVGCGTGAMTGWLAEQIGSDGSLDAIDITPAHVDATQRVVEGLPHVIVRHADLMDAESFKQSYDLIYCRMVLHHLPDGAAGMQALASYLKPGGILVCEEPPAMQNVVCYPPSEAISEQISLVVQAFGDNQVDFTIAYRLAKVAKQLGLQVTAQQIFQPLLDAPKQRMLHVMGWLEVGKQLIARQTITEAQYHVLAQAIEQDVLAADCISLYQMHQLIARKV